MVQDRCFSLVRWVRTLLGFGMLRLPSWCSSSEVRRVSWLTEANSWEAGQVSCTLQRLSCVSWWLTGNRKLKFLSGMEEFVMDRRCSRWKSFSSSIPPSLQSSNPSASRAGIQVESCFRCFLLPERTDTIPTCRWARLRQNRWLYRENCCSTIWKPRHRGRDLSSRCLKCEQVQRTLSLSLQDRKLNTWSQSSAGSCSTDVITTTHCNNQSINIDYWLSLMSVHLQLDRKLECWHHHSDNLSATNKTCYSDQSIII